jgi:hypothetical protein
MKLDPGMHIGLHLVSFGKSGVTQAKESNTTLVCMPLMPAKLILSLANTTIELIHSLNMVAINNDYKVTSALDSLKLSIYAPTNGTCITCCQPATSVNK